MGFILCYFLSACRRFNRVFLFTVLWIVVAKCNPLIVAIHNL